MRSPPRPRAPRRGSSCLATAGRRAGLLAPLVAAALALPSGLAAQSADPDTGRAAPLVGDRPDFTESASVVTRLQLETGYSFASDDGTDVHTVGELLVRIPTGSRLEARVGVPSWTHRREGGPPESTSSGLTDGSLGVKLGLADAGEEGAGPALALLIDTSLPTGEIGSEAAEPAARLAAGLELSDGASVGANVGVASAGAGEERYAELLASLALGHTLGGAVAAYLEAYGFAPTGGGPAASSVVDGGLTWLVGPDLQLDLRAEASLTGPAPEVAVGAGAVWRP